MFVSLATLALLFAAGCGPAKKDPAASKNALTQAAVAGKVWKLDKWVGVDGSKQTTGVITIAFDEKLRVSGNAGVNAYMGPAKFTEAGAIDFSGFISTRMAGLPEAQAREDRYLRELRLVREAAIEDGRLIFVGDGKLRMEFVGK